MEGGLTRKSVKGRKIPFRVLLWAFAFCLAGAANAIADDAVTIYAAGYSVDSHGVEVAGYWKNGTWVGLTPLDTEQDAYVRALAIVGADVYAGGWSDTNINVPGYWKNRAWVQLTPFDAADDAMVYFVVVGSADVYAGGFSMNSSGREKAGYWKNGAWVALPLLDANVDTEPHEAGEGSDAYYLVLSGSDLCAGGCNLSSDQVELAG